MRRGRESESLRLIGKKGEEELWHRRSTKVRDRESGDLWLGVGLHCCEVQIEAELKMKVRVEIDQVRKLGVLTQLG